jgi:hypothetical protein
MGLEARLGILQHQIPMITTVRLGLPNERSQIPARSIVFCTNCFDPQYITKTKIRVQQGSLIGTWGVLFPGRGRHLYCHNCGYHIFENQLTRTDSIMSNTVTSPSKYMATYIECNNFWSYLAGSMLLDYSLDAYSHLWTEWALA